MSARFFQSSTPQRNQSIKVNDALVRNNLTVAGSTTTAGIQVNDLNVDGTSALRKVVFDPLPAGYSQATNANSPVNITGNEESFDVATVALTTAAGGIQAFNISNSSIGAYDMILLTQISYSGTYNVDGAIVAHIAAVSAGVVTVGIKNWGSGTANGLIKLRFKIFHNTASS